MAFKCVICVEFILELSTHRFDMKINKSEISNILRTRDNFRNLIFSLYHLSSVLIWQDILPGITFSSSRIRCPPFSHRHPHYIIVIVSLWQSFCSRHLDSVRRRALWVFLRERRDSWSSKSNN